MQADTFMVATKPKKPAPTALDAFIRDPKKKKPAYDMPSFIPVTEAANRSNGSASGDQQPPPKPASRKSRQQAPPSGPPPKRRFTSDKSFDPDIVSIRLDDLLRVFSESRIHFADTQSIWLKDMAAYLNHLLPYELSDPTACFRKNNDANYPCSLLKSDVRAFLRELLEDCTNPTLQLFQSHCVETVIRNMGMQRPVAGYMIMMQVMGQEFPDVSISNMQLFIESVNVNRPRPAVSIPLCWLAQQSMQSSPPDAARMWSQLIAPLTGSSNSANIKSYNEFAIHCLHLLLSMLARDPESRVTPSSYNAIFDFLACQKSNVNNSSKVMPLFPKLRAAALRKESDPAAVTEIFTHFLRRLSDSSAHREEVKNVLLDCLLASEETFAHWITVEKKYTNGSSLLLEHLSESGLLHKLPQKLFLQTISQLKATAESSDNRTDASERSLQAIGVSCSFTSCCMSAMTAVASLSKTHSSAG